MKGYDYSNLSFAEIKNPPVFFKDTGLPEVSKVRSLYDAAKVVFNLPGHCVRLFMAEGYRIYRINLHDVSAKKPLLGWMIYSPTERRLDIFTTDNSMEPIIQFVDKKVTAKGYPLLLEKLGFEKLFVRLVSIS